MPAASAFVTLAGLQPNLPLEVPRDFTPIGFIGEQPMFLTVTPQLGVASLKDFIALAKQQPGKLSYAATGRGTMTHLTGELLKSRAGIDVLAVPYTGGAPQALNDALGGRLSMVIEGLAALSGSIQGGTMKAIAVGSPERLKVFPTCRPPPRCCPASTRAAGRRWSRRSARRRRSSTRSARRCARWSASPRCRASSRSPAAMCGR